MKILSIEHVQLAIPAGEEDAARTFYINVLGFTEMPKPPQISERGGLWLRSGNVQLHLGVDHDFHPARKTHPAFLVMGLDSALEKIQVAGYEWDLSQPPLDGFNRAHIYDPFGNRIELMEKI